MLTPISQSIELLQHLDALLFIPNGTNVNENTTIQFQQTGSLTGQFPCYRGIPAGGPRTLIGDEITLGNVCEAIFDSTLCGGNGGFHIIPSINMPTQNTLGHRSDALWTSETTFQQTGVSGVLSLETGNNGVIGWASGMAGAAPGQACDISVFRKVGTGSWVNIAPNTTLRYLMRIRSVNGISLPFCIPFFDFPDAGDPPAAVYYEIRFKAAESGGLLAYINRTPGGEPTGEATILLQEAQGQ